MRITNRAWKNRLYRLPPNERYAAMAAYSTGQRGKRVDASVYSPYTGSPVFPAFNSRRPQDLKLSTSRNGENSGRYTNHTSHATKEIECAIIHNTAQNKEGAVAPEFLRQRNTTLDENARAVGLGVQQWWCLSSCTRYIIAGVWALYREMLTLPRWPPASFRILPLVVVPICAKRFRRHSSRPPAV